MQHQVQSQLAEIRKRRGVSATDLAKRVGSSRQTIYAIEAGSFVPNTEVTLRLAQALEVRVEELFQLATDTPPAPRHLRTDLLSDRPMKSGQAVRVCQVGEHQLSVPVNTVPYYLPEADGVLAKAGKLAEVVLFAQDESYQKRLVLAGCDPAIGLLSRMVERLSGVEMVAVGAASQLALRWLVEGKVHIAGTHLEDPTTGEFNLPYLQSQYPNEDFVVVTFSQWEQGWVFAPGRKVSHANDLRQLTFINREPGSGSRALLDRLLKTEGVPAVRVHGYQRIADGHLAAAYAVQRGEADVCLATQSAARAFNLEFRPIRAERYDFVMRRDTLAWPAAQALLDTLQRASLRRKLEVLAGYDTSRTGRMV
ncbi:MAG: helix-turn-helix domain-containing protein [Bryobacteraceae bacterium]|nr:helix-turn-helix domain-containing protein [Bryobacteraceae bacterium]